MAQGIWEDFTEKFGFGDGASTEDRDFRARDILIRTLNQQPEMKAAGVRTVAYDRPGVHNGCMILVGKNIEGMPDDKFLEAVLETDEVELPEMAAEIAELIAEAYAEADQPAPPSGRNRGDQATSLYHVLHTHGEGTTPYLVRAAEEPTQERLIEALGIDFAPEREEFIEVYPVDFNKPFDLDGPATTPQPCGHVPADPNAEQTPCELCGQTVAPDPDEPHLWRTLVYLAAARDPRIPVHERDNPPSEEVLKARAGLLPSDPQDDEPEDNHGPITVFNDCELNTVLHALAILKETRVGGNRHDWNGCWARDEFKRLNQVNVKTACDHFEEVEPLTDAQIDALCDRLQL